MISRARARPSAISVSATSGGLEKIQSGALELSNVDLTEHSSNLITSQRSFQAGSCLITVSGHHPEDIVSPALIKQRASARSLRPRLIPAP
jgi:flagellar hook protein FlgE